MMKVKSKRQQGTTYLFLQSNIYIYIHIYHSVFSYGFLSCSDVFWVTVSLRSRLCSLLGSLRGSRLTILLTNFFS